MRKNVKKKVRNRRTSEKIREYLLSALCVEFLWIFFGVVTLPHGRRSRPSDQWHVPLTPLKAEPQKIPKE